LLILAGLFLFSVPTEKKKIISEIRGTYGCKDNAVYSKLSQYINHRDSDIRYEAIYAIYVYLGNTGIKGRARDIIHLLKDSDDRVRAWAAGTLGLLQDKSAVSDLISMLKDTSIYVRIRVVEALGMLGIGNVKSNLMDTIRNDIWYIGAKALKSLEKLNQK
jgi:HEAT repeat protein